uniref:Uncharacterized protein n=1 Tax=Anguilla anguilla TaxID=7936 RepID=A0A0E9Q218_ANGAN
MIHPGLERPNDNPLTTECGEAMSIKQCK